MARLLNDPDNTALIHETASVRKKAAFYCEAERSFYLQKVKCKFINEGDKCSKFFHSLMKKQTALNSIPFVITSQGTTTTSLEPIVDEFIGHFSTIFGQTVPTSPIDWDVFKEGPLVQDFEAKNLNRKVDMLEVKEALFSIGNDKSPGPDGMIRKILCGSRFTHHLRCAKLGITHIAFADDVMMFCRGNMDSVTVLTNAIKEFSQVSGLHVNPLKSNIYLAGEIKDNKHDLLSLVSFPEGKLPVRYLGLPLTSQRASERDFASLVAKVDENIRKWNTRSLSPAGRLELVRSVIQGVEGFWFQAFPIHKTILDRITSLCRTFVWGSKFCKVAWADDTLWIQWVHSVYLQGSNFWTWIPSKKDSHFFKKIADVRDSLLQKCGDRFMIEDNLCDIGDMKATKVYELLRSKASMRPWMKVIWQPYIPPRYSFTVWLTLRGRLPTKMNLHFIPMDNRRCEFCHTEEETTQHLFFLCEITSLIWGTIKNWLKITPALSTLERSITWARRQRHNHCAKRKLWRLAILSTVYNIWRSRNGVYFDKQPIHADTIINKIKVGIYKVMYRLFPQDMLDL
ncbi:unnamed protein product [Cuscuta campestris]|uniref:Reverse transcriptase zinc-binding domain-containing protein n=1 Tax=Cuscuta campestris TaxID=132261 RepID=A0A484N7X2_9ASTE|nr:unnamed protein product [Cuscuta campestris]